MKKFGGFLGNAFDGVAYLANLQNPDITSNENKTIKFMNIKPKPLKAPWQRMTTKTNFLFCLHNALCLNKFTLQYLSLILSKLES